MAVSAIERRLYPLLFFHFFFLSAESSLYAHLLVTFSLYNSHASLFLTLSQVGKSPLFHENHNNPIIPMHHKPRLPLTLDTSFSNPPIISLKISLSFMELSVKEADIISLFDSFTHKCSFFQVLLFV